MPLHDWSNVPTWRFHNFHAGWLIYIRDALNRGLLPPGYSAQAEQRATLYGPDVLALTPAPRVQRAPTPGGVAVAEPRADRRTVLASPVLPSRAVTVRHTSGERIVAVVEIVSRANKDRPATVADFTDKVAGLLGLGVHVVVIDVLPPGRHDPGGMHAAVCDAIGVEVDDPAGTTGSPLTLASYRADPLPPVAFLLNAAVGRPLPDLPLFLDDGVFVHLPAEATYMQGIEAMDAASREALTAS